jgi:hypothetical protein
MNNQVPQTTRHTFTAAQLAAVAGLTKRRVLQLLRGTPPAAAQIIRGQSTDAWAADPLPQPLALRLDSLVAQRRFRDRESLLLSGGTPYSPDRPWDQIAPRDKAFAQCLKLALAGPLERMADLSITEPEFRTLGVRDFAAAFSAAPPEHALPRTISPRHWTRLWERTLARDGGREEWNRLEIYLPERLGGSPRQPAIAPVLFESIASAIPLDLTQDKPAKLARLWHAAFLRLEELCAQGHTEKKIRRQLVAYLYQQAPFLAGSLESLRVQSLQKLAHWRAHGRTWETLQDGRHENPGRTATWAHVLKDQAACAELRSLYLATLGAASPGSERDRHTGSMALALQRFADTEPAAQYPGLLLELRKGRQPVCLLRYLRRITPELEAKLRGPKAYDHHGPVGTRDHTIKGPDGLRYQLPATAIFEADDMSCNQPFFAEDEHGNVILSRQGLYAYAPLCRRWLAVDLIARPREAYRAEDVLRFFRRVFEASGKPLILRLEQGVWAARKIKGIRLTPTGHQEEEWLRPAMPQEEVARIQDGLAATGVAVQYVTKAKGKGGIESGFNYLQTVLATFTRHWLNLGRHAGEFAHAAQQLRRVRAGSHHPADLGFAPMPDLKEVILRAMAWINARERDQRTPDKLWQLHAEQLKPVTQDDLAAFLPDHRELVIRGGRITAQVDRQPLHFREPELFADLGDGYRLAARFDPCEPTLGAAIYNLQTGPRNHHAFAHGQRIGWATFEPPGYQLATEDPRMIEGLQLANVSRYGADPEIGLKLRAQQSKWHRTEFGALPRPGQPAIKASITRDGRGNIAKVEQGGRRMQTPAETTFQHGTRQALGISSKLGVSVSNRLAHDPEACDAAEQISRFLADHQTAEDPQP